MAALRILVADDDPDTVQTFALLLRSFGHQVETASNSAVTLEMARRSKPQLIFLDIGMPDMDGWQLAPLLRQQLENASVRIVAVSGHADREAHIRSRKAGFDAHVAKPVDLPLLESILTQMQDA